MQDMASRCSPNPPQLIIPSIPPTLLHARLVLHAPASDIKALAAMTIYDSVPSSCNRFDLPLLIMTAMPWKLIYISAVV